MKRKINLLPFIFIALFIFLLNWYTLSGLLVISTSKFLIPVFWMSIAGISGAFIYVLLQFGRKKEVDFLFTSITHTVLILLTAELVLSLSLFLGDGYRLFSGSSRSLYWVEFSFLLFTFTVLLFIYGMIFGKYKYRVIRHVLYFDDLPEAFDGFKIAQISDVHAGSFNNPKAIQRGIDLINQQQADLFVFTGDLVNNRAEEIKPWMPYFSQIRAPYGQFSILGNHDYGDYVQWTSEAEKSENLRQLKQYHAELGFNLLLDSHTLIHKGQQHLFLAGVENWGVGFGQRGDLKKAMFGAENNDFKILLSHDPTHWEAEVKTFAPKIHLTLAGHTHGMQFGIEAFGLKWSPVKYRYAHWAGIKEENGRTLNINRGFGFLGFSGRIGIWPEITILELRRKS
ncbi:metallophosphoesterase [Pedobacter sp. AW31-3R]|uniref:metallophosphoesterase n=1 Tax=Pedobacter sp. AW31-3R TaxID=3445781 RepID=UPI003F9EC8FC